jgi:hypothetical protein
MATNNTRPSEWLIIATKYDPVNGNLTDQVFERFTTTFSDMEVITHIAPSMVEGALIGERRFDQDNIKLYKIFQVPLGFTEEDDDEDEE